VDADIEHLQEAEGRRSAAAPNSAQYHEAVFDIQERALRIVMQVTEDQAVADKQARLTDRDPD
jgi:hypothetical protein